MSGELKLDRISDAAKVEDADATLSQQYGSMHRGPSLPKESDSQVCIAFQTEIKRWEDLVHTPERIAAGTDEKGKDFGGFLMAANSMRGNHDEAVTKTELQALARQGCFDQDQQKMLDVALNNFGTLSRMSYDPGWFHSKANLFEVGADISNANLSTSWSDYAGSAPYLKDNYKEKYQLAGVVAGGVVQAAVTYMFPAGGFTGSTILATLGLLKGGYVGGLAGVLWGPAAGLLAGDEVGSHLFNSHWQSSMAPRLHQLREEIPNWQK